MTQTSAVEPCFQLKSASVSLTTLELQFYEPEAFEATLRDKIRQAPGFFQNTPLLLGLEKYQGEAQELDFFQIIGTCRRHNMNIVGVRGGDDDARRLARTASLALLPSSSGRDRPVDMPQTRAAEPEPVAEPAVAAPTRVIHQPVRSGQQVLAPDGDLVILAPVQAGAEVLAAGSIHVYGPLRGRALAGIHGQESARVFCQSLEAELVSIAGHYKISEDLQGTGWKAAAHIRLEDDLLMVTPLDKS